MTIGGSIEMGLARETLSNQWVKLLLVLILAVGAVLRLYGLDKQSLWNDELSSWRRSDHVSLATVVDDSIQNDVHPPGFQVLLYFVEKHVGDSETTLRLPSAVSGVLSILAVFLLGSQIYSRREGLVAAALMAVLWYPVYYSQEARPYATVLLLTLATTSLWILLAAAIKEKKTPKLWVSIAYICAAAMLAYFRYTGLYLVALQGLGLFVFSLVKRTARGPIVLIYLSIIIAYLPWLPGFWTQMQTGAAWTAAPPRPPVSGYFQYIFNKSRPFMWVAIGMWVFLLVVSLLRRLRDSRQRRVKGWVPSSGVLLSIWLLLPIATTYALPPVNAGALYRNLVICLPPAYLLLARAIAQIPLRPNLQTAIVCIGATFLLAHLLIALEYYSKPHKQQFREAVVYVAENDRRYEDSLVVGYAWHKVYFDYYFERVTSHRGIEVFASQAEDLALVEDAISERDPSYVWFLRAHKKPEQAYFDFFDAELTLIDHKSLIGADVWLYEKGQQASQLSESQ